MQFKQKGIGLLEIMLVLAVASAIIILSTRYFYTTRQTQNLSTTIALVGDIHKAAITYVKRKDYASGNLTLANLKSSGLLTTVQTTNPWGGNLSIGQGGTNNQQVVIGIDNVPSKICFEIQKRLLNTARPGESALCSGGVESTSTLTVQYDLY